MGLLQQIGRNGAARRKVDKITMVKVYIASDHAGFVKKQELAQKLSESFEVIDLGPEEIDPKDDYPIFAERVGNAVIEDPGSYGVLVCKSGQGMEIAANKVDGVRAALVWNKHLAMETRNDNDSNIMSLPSGELSIEEMFEITTTFLTTPFSGAGRHKRRLDEIRDIEEEQA